MHHQDVLQKLPTNITFHSIESVPAETSQECISAQPFQVKLYSV